MIKFARAEEPFFFFLNVPISLAFEIERMVAEGN